MKVTLEDIAKETGYSVSTISRVLNGSSRISNQTKQVVLEGAEKLNYLTPKRRYIKSPEAVLNVALIASGFEEGPFYVAFFHGLNKAAAKSNIRLSLIGTLNTEKELAPLLKEVSLYYYDAAILFIPEFSRGHYDKILEKIPKGFPIVSNALIENPLFPTITFDGYSGGYLAAKHFDEKQYKTMGIIQGPFERVESRYRNNGFTDYIHQNPDLELLFVSPGDFTFESGFGAFNSFRKLDKKPRAVFASNDDMAAGFIEAAKQHGFRIPEDIAVMGYDNLPASRRSIPQISSIHTDYEKLGEATMKVLREQVMHPRQHGNMLSIVPVSVKVRAST